MESAEIGRRWTQFFSERGHTPVRSAPLTADDPELLFVVAGMQPFKPYFRGDEVAPWKRAVSIQKCVRTPDIEEVGKTTRHLTFFQMAGNFSFGDYFKEGAIRLAWELVTGSPAEGGYGFDPQRIWVTVYQDDDEAAQLWEKVAGLPEERIQRRGIEDDVRFRVIADHARSGVMLVGDGVTPGNEARGYVLRRLLRRIVRSSRLLGVSEPVLGQYAEVVRHSMGASYPELVSDFGRIDA